MCVWTNLSARNCIIRWFAEMISVIIVSLYFFHVSQLSNLVHMELELDLDWEFLPLTKQLWVVELVGRFLIFI